MKYQTILFDVDGTLLDFDRAEKEGMDEVLRAYGLTPTDELHMKYHVINKRLWKEFEQGMIEKNQIMETRFSEFFGDLGMKVDGLEAERLYREQLNQSAVLIDGAVDILEYLSGKYELYVVTNGVSKTQYQRLSKSGLDKYFKDIFVSEDAKSQKPQKEFFDYCFSRMPAVSLSGMLIIGDALNSDIKGGNAAGIDTCWYNPQVQEKDLAVHIDYEIKNLKELEFIL